MSKDRRLGRGLAALLGTDSEGHTDQAPVGPTSLGAPASAPLVAADSPAGSEPAAGGLLQLNVHEIDDNPFQPRRDFSDTEIAALSESLKRHEMLQPVLVRRAGDRYQLISGERRLRAAIQAGWATVPARIREADDRLAAELAIVENLQRKDLNPIEKAISFKRYLDEHQCTQEELAQRLRIDRSTVANLLRLLELPDAVVQHVRAGRLSAGHARALLPLGDEPLQQAYANQLLEEGWSVRETERRVQDHIQSADQEPLQIAGFVGPDGDQPTRKQDGGSQQVAALEQELRTALGTRVDIRQSRKGRGRIVIHFTSHDEFDRLRALLATGETPPQVETG